MVSVWMNSFPIRSLFDFCCSHFHFRPLALRLLKVTLFARRVSLTSVSALFSVFFLFLFRLRPSAFPRSISSRTHTHTHVTPTQRSPSSSCNCCRFEKKKIDAFLRLFSSIFFISYLSGSASAACNTVLTIFICIAQCRQTNTLWYFAFWKHRFDLCRQLNLSKRCNFWRSIRRWHRSANRPIVSPDSIELG